VTRACHHVTRDVINQAGCLNERHNSPTSTTELPRDLSKLKSKFWKPLIAEFILDELCENVPRLECVGTGHAEHDVTLEEGRRFAFIYSVKQKYVPFL